MDVVVQVGELRGHGSQRRGNPLWVADFGESGHGGSLGGGWGQESIRQARAAGCQPQGLAAQAISATVASKSALLP